VRDHREMQAVVQRHDCQSVVAVGFGQLNHRKLEDAGRGVEAKWKEGLQNAMRRRKLP